MDADRDSDSADHESSGGSPGPDGVAVPEMPVSPPVSPAKPDRKQSWRWRHPLFVALVAALVTALITPALEVVVRSPLQGLIDPESLPEIRIDPEEATVHLGQTIQFRLVGSSLPESKERRWVVGSAEATCSRAARCKAKDDLLTCIFLVPGHHSLRGSIPFGEDGVVSGSASVEAVSDQPYLLLVPVMTTSPDAADRAMRVLLNGVDWPTIQAGLSTRLVLNDPDTDELVLAGMLTEKRWQGCESADGLFSNEAADAALQREKDAELARSGSSPVERSRIGFSLDRDVLPAEAWVSIVSALASAGIDVVVPALTHTPEGVDPVVEAEYFGLIEKRGSDWARADPTLFAGNEPTTKTRSADSDSFVSQAPEAGSGLGISGVGRLDASDLLRDPKRRHAQVLALLGSDNPIVVGQGVILVQQAGDRQLASMAIEVIRENTGLTPEDKDQLIWNTMRRDPSPTPAKVTLPTSLVRVSEIAEWGDVVTAANATLEAVRTDPPGR